MGIPSVGMPMGMIPTVPIAYTHTHQVGMGMYVGAGVG